MMKFVVVYKNESTGWEWLKLHDFKFIPDARRYVGQVIADFPKSVLGIIVETETVGWRERKPRLVYNAYNDPAFGRINGFLSGLINSKDSSWF